MAPHASSVTADVLTPAVASISINSETEKGVPLVSVADLPTPPAEAVQHTPSSRPLPTFSPTRTIEPYFELENHPIDDVPPIKAIVIGAGISGINCGILLPRKVPGLQLTILERCSDLGGTWHTNIYPGVKCDIPSDVYQSTYSPKTDWSENYAPGGEIAQYWRGVAEKYNATQYIKFNTSVTRADWDVDRQKWIVKTIVNGTKSKDGVWSGGEEGIEEGDFLITAMGHFSSPRLPNYPGQETYKGHLVHSSLWDPSFDPAGKRIAVIGNGASGLQVVPNLANISAHVTHFARSKTWIAGSFAGHELHRGPGRVVPPQDPEGYFKHRQALEESSWSHFPSVIKGSETNKKLAENFSKMMAERLGDRTDLLAKIKPDFSPSCRRLTPGPGYLEALQREHVDLVSEKISHFTATGIVTEDGVERQYDAVICSTGADITFAPQFPVTNGQGVDLSVAWRPGGSPGYPDTYLGVGAPNFPNFLQLLGPNGTGLGGTVPHAVESQVTYAAKVLRKLASQGILSLAPTDEATRDFKAYAESFFPSTVMSENCRSWYNSGVPGGRITGMWPGSGGHAVLTRREPRWEDFRYVYGRRGQDGGVAGKSQNRFAYLGNGWTVKDVKVSEKREEDDLVGFTGYLRKEAVGGEVDLRVLHEEWYEGVEGLVQ